MDKSGFARIGMLAGIGIVLASLLPAMVAAQGVDGALSVYNLQTNPNPVVAGGNVTLTLQLYDSYSSTLQNVDLQLEGSYPILNFSPMKSYIISSMSQGIYGGSDNYFTYNLHIPKNTSSGTYTLNLVATYQTSETSVTGTPQTVTGQSTMPISFYVNGAPEISISSQASAISPGSASTVTLSVLNSGYGTAKNITITLLSNKNFTAIGSTMFRIGTLAEGSSASVTADYQASSFLANGTYMLPMQVSYSSETGKLYNETIEEQVGVLINTPNIVVNISSAQPSALYHGYNQSLVLSISNVGTGTAKNVSVSLSPSQGISILSSVKSFFIGSLAAGESTTEQVLISAGNYTTTNASLSARIGYYAQNYQGFVSRNASIGLSVAQASLFSISQGNYTLVPGSTDVNITYVIKNTGNVDAKDLQLSFQSIYPITPVTSSYYIAELAPGESANVVFQASVDTNGNPGTYPITVYEDWRQPNGAQQQSYSGSNPYYAVVASSGSALGGMVTDIVIAAVVIVAAVLIVRRRMSKQKGQAKKK